jgi:hypothetical protein
MKTKITTCKLCGGHNITTWVKAKHTFCHTCRGHRYKGKWITAQKWEADMEAAFPSNPPPQTKPTS